MQDFGEQEPLQEQPPRRGIAPFKDGFEKDEDAKCVYINGIPIPTPFGLVEFGLRREKEEDKYADIVPGYIEFELKEDGQLAFELAEDLVDKGAYKVMVTLYPKVGELDALSGLRCTVWIDGQNGPTLKGDELNSSIISEDIEPGEELLTSLGAEFTTIIDGEEVKRELFVVPTQKMLDTLRIGFEQGGDK